MTTTSRTGGATMPQAWQPWIRSYRQTGEPVVRLFCFHHAVGGASAFSQWPQHFAPGAQVLGVQLPGREDRLAEPAFERLPALIDALAPALLPLLDLPYAFFGHSMGALIAFELARRLNDRHGTAPVHLFVGAREAPQLGTQSKGIHQAPTPVLLSELRRMGGTPEAVLADAELAAIVLGIMRADYALYETYVYAEGARLPCPITAFGGRQDEGVQPEGLMAWRDQSSRGFDLHMLDGDHFFLHSDRPTLAGLVRRALDGSVASRPVRLSAPIL